MPEPVKTNAGKDGGHAETRLDTLLEYDSTPRCTLREPADASSEKRTWRF